MTSPLSAISGISGIAGLSGVSPTSSVTSASSASASSGADFAAQLADGFDSVNAAQSNANSLAVQAATGQLTDPAQLTIATTQAQLMTQLATTVQAKAVAAFNSIMGMQA